MIQLFQRFIQLFITFLQGADGLPGFKGDIGPKGVQVIILTVTMMGVDQVVVVVVVVGKMSS